MNNNAIYIEWKAEKSNFFSTQSLHFIICLSILSVLILLILLLIKKRGWFNNEQHEFRRGGFYGVLIVLFSIAAFISTNIYFGIGYESFKERYFNDHKEQLLTEEVIEVYGIYGVETKSDDVVYIARKINMKNSQEYYRYSIMTEDGIEFKNIETSNNSVYFKEWDQEPKLVVSAQRFADDRMFDAKNKEESLFKDFIEFVPNNDIDRLLNFGKNKKYSSDKKYTFYVPKNTIESTFSIN